MKKIRYILLFVIVLTGTKAFAQQDPLYTQYMQNVLTINPAYAGSRGVLSASVIVREALVGISGDGENPSNIALFGHAPIKKKNMGIGGSIYNYSVGAESNLGLFADYSYTLDLDRKKKISLSFGLKGGFSSYGVDLADAQIIDPSDPLVYNISRSFMPNFGVGIYLSSPTYYVGFSAPKLLQNELTEYSFDSKVTEALRFYFMGGYVFDVNPIIKIKPYFMLNAVQNAPISTDLTLQLLLFDRLWLGTSFRLGDATSFMGQIKVTDQLTVGYAYDLTINEMAAYNRGTHEVFINFDFDFGTGRVRSPRYF